MIPTRFALAVCLLAPSLAAHSQTTDQSAPAKIGATEFSAISTSQPASFEKELNRVAGHGFRLERLLDATTIM
jgi:lipopolysaccharide export system protein LptA